MHEVEKPVWSACAQHDLRVTRIVGSAEWNSNQQSENAVNPDLTGRAQGRYHVTGHDRFMEGNIIITQHNLGRVGKRTGAAYLLPRTKASFRHDPRLAETQHNHPDIHCGPRAATLSRKSEAE